MLALNELAQKNVGRFSLLGSNFPRYQALQIQLMRFAYGAISDQEDGNNEERI